MNFQNVNANYLLAIIKIIILSLNEKKKISTVQYS